MFCKGVVVVSTYSLVASVAAQVQGLQITAIGLIIVFGVLSLLWAVMTILNSIFPGEDHPAAETTKKSTPSPKPEPDEGLVTSSMPAKEQQRHTTPGADPRVVTAIAAVIYTMGISPEKITVRRVSSRRPKKKVAALAAAVESYLGPSPKDITIQKVEER